LCTGGGGDGYLACMFSFLGVVVSDRLGVGEGQSTSALVVVMVVMCTCMVS